MIYERQERFGVDTANFAPPLGSTASPHVNVSRQSDEITISLRNARFPGAAIRADMDVSIYRDSATWMVAVTFLETGWYLTAPLDAWLRGRQPAIGRLNRPMPLLMAGAAPQLSLTRHGWIGFYVDWSMNFERTQATFAGTQSKPLLASRVTMLPAPEPTDSLLYEPMPLRTVFRLERGQQSWGWLADLPPLSDGEIETLAEPFDVLDIEAGEDAHGQRRIALVGYSHHDGSAARVRFGANRGLAQCGNWLALARLQQAVAFEADGLEMALFAGLAHAEQALRVGQLQITVKDPDKAPALQIVAQPASQAEVRLEPDLAAVRLPLGDAIVQSSRVPRESRIDIAIDFDACPSGKGALALMERDGQTMVELRNLSTVLLRPLDMLFLQLDLKGLEYFEVDGKPFLRKQRGVAAYLKVHFPPQHIAEMGVTGDHIERCRVGDLLPFKSLLAGGSRLVFHIPPHYESEPIPVRIERLLDWRDLQPAVNVRALPDIVGSAPPGTKPKREMVRAPLLPAHWDRDSTIPTTRPTPEKNPPGEDETQIEIPYGIYLSPHKWSQWHHALQPVIGMRQQSAGGSVDWIELWHTRLGYFHGEGIDDKGRVVSNRELGLHPKPGDTVADPRSDLRTLRAIYSRKYPMNCGSNSTPFPLLPSLSDATEIVDLSSRFDLLWNYSESGAEDQCAPYQPSAIPYTHFMLSALGGTLRLKGEWNPSRVRDSGTCALRPSAIDQWMQDTVWSRDQSVLISKKGYCCPTGHYTSYVRIRRREFVPVVKQLSGKPTILGYVAAPRERYYCEVKEPTIEYKLPADEDLADDGMPRSGRAWPFRSVTIEPRRTPFLKKPFDWTRCETEADDPRVFWMIPEDDQGSGGFTPPSMCKSDAAGTSALYEQPFEFTITAVDLQGRTHQFKAPLPWVHRYYAERSKAEPSWRAGDKNECDRISEPGPDSVSFLQEIIKAYLTGEISRCGNVNWKDRRCRDFGGQKLSYAPPATNRDQTKDTAFETGQICLSIDGTMKAIPPNVPAAYRAEMPDHWPLAFYPALDEATVRLGSVATIAGNDDASGARIAFNTTYRRIGFFVPKDPPEDIPRDPPFEHTNKGELFLDVDISGEKSSTQLRFPARNSGGLAVPSFQVAHLSRLLGPVGPGPRPSKSESGGGTLAVPERKTQFQQSLVVRGKFDPKDFFQAMGAQLLGAIDLGEVAETVEDVVSEIDAAVQLVEEKYRQVAALVEQVEEIRAQIKEIKDFLSDLPRHRQALESVLTQLIEEQIDIEIDTLVDGVSQKITQEWRVYIARSIEVALANVAFDLVRELQSMNVEAYIGSFSPSPPLREVEAIRRIHSRSVEELQRAFDFAHVETTFKVAVGRVEAALQGFRELPFKRLRALEQRVQDLGDAINLNRPDESLDRVKRELSAISNEFRSIAESKEKFRKDEVKAFADVTKAFAVARDQIFVSAGAFEAIRENFNKLAKIWDRLSETDLPDALAFRAPASLSAWPGYVRNLKATAARIDRQIDDKIDYLEAQLECAIVKNLSELRTGMDRIDDEFQTKYAQLVNGFVDEVFAVVSRFLPPVLQIVALAEQVLSQIPNKIKVKYSWRPRLRSVSGFVANFDNRPSTCEIRIEVHKQLLSELNEPPKVTIFGHLSDFQVELLPDAKFFIVGVSNLQFRSDNGEKPQVDVKIGDVALGEELDFVKELAQLFSPSDGFYVDLSPFRAEVGYRYNFPAMVAGGFNIVQLALQASVRLYFNGDPVRARFAVSRRDKPFYMTAGVYGGGGFFAIDVDPKGVRQLEASFEFGAIAFASIGGVANGFAYATGGVYYATADSMARLSGFFHCGGAFDIAGLITLALDFYLGFTYERQGNQSAAVGECVLTIEIEIGFFEVSYDIGCRKELSSGSAGAGQPSLQSKLQVDQRGPPTASVGVGEPSLPLREEWTAYRNSFAF